MSMTQEEIVSKLSSARELSSLCEVFLISDSLAEWRLSYGQRTADVYFIAMYPAFCHTHKAVIHYTSLDKLCDAINEIIQIIAAAKADRCDALAVLFSLSRGKESFELFQEQRELMLLGLKSLYLDNFYQDKIKQICGACYKTQQLFGITPDFKKIFNYPLGAI